MESLQERLKAVRGAMTQSEFATRLRTPLTTLGRYERGANMPDLEFIINVCTVFDVSPSWLLFGRGAMREQSKEHLASGCGCRQCPLLLKELEEERAVRAAVSALSDRERLIISLRYGLDGQREETQKEVAERLGISQSYISRLEKKIFSRLKEDIGSKI